MFVIDISPGGQPLDEWCRPFAVAPASFALTSVAIVKPDHDQSDCDQI